MASTYGNGAKMGGAELCPYYCTDVGSSEAEQIARDSLMIAECGRLLGARGRDHRKLFVLHGNGSNREEENF